LACKQPGVNAYFDSKEIVKSICIDICSSTVSEAFTVLTAQKDHQLDDYLAGYFKTPEFFEVVCPVRGSHFDKKLNELALAIQHGNVTYVNKEWFLDLALNGIRSVKLETRKEILRRLKLAKHYIDEKYLDIADINQVANICNMSEFHFYRSFREAFHTTPYQYILTKRLELSKQLLLAGNASVTEIALHCNFPDVYTFSKAFKRHFNISPSGFLAVRP
jgi:AraC-like DNA-binding protein